MSESTGKRPARGKPVQKPSGKLRGNPRESEEVRISKTLSYILRHGAKSEGLRMREDGYVQVRDLLTLPKMSSLNIMSLEKIVKEDSKMRYHLLFEPKGDASESSARMNPDCWWIRANQGHSLKDVKLDHAPLTDSGQVPMAVHGTTLSAWKSIQTQGLSRMKRQHIHLAQGVAGTGVVSGMRNSSEVLIFIDLEKAMKAGIKFVLSSNGVVLTEGDENGFLHPQFFRRVEGKNKSPIRGWEGKGPIESATKLLEETNLKEIPVVDTIVEVEGSQEKPSISSEEKPDTTERTSQQ
ncbi:hypothetical protein SCHPADRAFT_820636 [Schizopora paradoxa]|uniref:2'-phosphotransferase n=1 Tax=Schizopora paradoxa TaxID=27342 RepID=A0A0H2S2B1_9AGAM|nr:hypothetical protein SCHPADRAFT_820636 [Schizopora paradoxa]